MKEFRALKKLIGIVFDNLKLKYKLSLVYIFIIIIPIIIVGEYSYFRAESFMVNEVVSSLEKELLQASEDINHKLLLCQQESDFLFLYKPLRDTLSETYTNNMQRLKAYIDVISPTVNSIRLLQLYDVRIYITNTTLFYDHKNIFSIWEIKDDPNYHLLIQGNYNMIWLPVSVIKNSTLSINNKKVLTLARSIYDLSNYKHLLGIIDVYIAVDVIDRVLNNIKLPNNGWGIYVDSVGNEITRFGSSSVNLSIVKNVLESNIPFGTTKNEDSIVVFRQTPLNKGKIIICYPKQYIYDKVNSIRKITRIIIAVSIIAVLIISFLLSNVITQRLYKLMDKIKHIRDTGDTSPTIVIEGNDEIADIDRMFNVMLTKINELTEKELKAEVAKRVMEMELLQAQINPHFLYNSLSSIKWAIINRKTADVTHVIDSLVKFYRLSLNKGNEITTVENELEIIKEYINIQKFTFDATYKVEWDIDENVKQCYCIKLLLQPFVENAILHGLNQKKDGILRITASLENSGIFFIIEDNGEGFDTSQLENDEYTSINSFYKGFGIRNAKNRIKLTYGDNYDVNIQSKIGQGTKVTIEIPALTYDQITAILS